MNQSELLQDVRDLVPYDAATLPDDLILRFADRVIESCVRKQIEQNEGWHNAAINLYRDDFRQVHRTEWDHQLPRWVERIVDVTERTADGGARRLSPWEVNSAESLRERVGRSRSNDIQSGWQFSGSKILRLRNFPAAIDIEVRVAKVPAGLIKGAIDYQHEETDHFYLPQSLTFGTEAKGKGAYIGAQFEVTSSTGEAFGDFRVGVASHPNREPDTSGTRRHDIQVAAPWSEELEVGAVFESIPEIGDSHARLVVYKVAQAIFQRHNNTKGLRSIADDLTEQWSLFVTTVTPRQNQEPTIVRRSLSSRRLSQDPDLAADLRR